MGKRIPADVSRRGWLKLAAGGGAALALDGLLDVTTVQAAARELKLSNVTEFTTSCNFCSCGCGMVAAVRDGKLITLEGDYDHVVNRGSLCVKGMSMFPTHCFRCRSHPASPGSATRCGRTWCGWSGIRPRRPIPR